MFNVGEIDYNQQLLLVKIPKAKKKTLMTRMLFVLLGSELVKALCKHVGENDYKAEVSNPFWFASISATWTHLI